MERKKKEEPETAPPGSVPICPYGYELGDKQMPCELTDDYDCHVCVNGHLTDVLSDLSENGIKMFLVYPEALLQEQTKGETRNGQEVPRRKRKVAPE